MGGGGGAAIVVVETFCVYAGVLMRQQKSIYGEARYRAALDC